MTIRRDEPRDLGSPPSLAEMESIAYQEFERIPEELRSRCVGVAIRVEDFADDEILDDMGIESPFDLMGLYQGIPLTQQSTLPLAGKGVTAPPPRRPRPRAAPCRRR